MKCNFCERDIPQGKTQCVFCKAFASGTRGKEKGSTQYGTSVALSDVQILSTPRLQSGKWDIVCGCNLSEDGQPLDYGPERTAVILLGGEPGAGKSTLALQWACAVAGVIGKDEYVLLLASEEAVATIKARAKRLGLQNLEKVRIQNMMTGEHTPSSYLESLAVKPVFTVIDSTKQYAAKLESECVAIKKIMADSKSIAILVHQVNKDFEFTGEMAIQHAVDVTIAFVKRTDGSNVREMLAIKNRMGRTNHPILWEMGEKGLTFLGIKEELESEEGKPKPGKKKAVAPVVEEPEEGETTVEEDDGSDETDECEVIPHGTIPVESTFFEDNPLDEPIEIEVDDGEVQTLSSKDLWASLNEAHKMWMSFPSEESRKSLEWLLELSGYTWDEPA